MPSGEPPLPRVDGQAEPALRFVYCAASTHLATLDPAFSARGSCSPEAAAQGAEQRSTRPADHLAYAAAHDGEALIRGLSAACDATRDATRTCWNAVWPGPVLWWAHRLAQPEPSPPRPDTPTPTPRSALRALVDWLCRNDPARGQSALHLWFAEESVHLAELGGYPNPARNETDPLTHLTWAVGMRPTTVIRDLLDKSGEQYQRRGGQGPSAQAVFCAGLLARAVSWGGLPPAALVRGAPRTGVPADWSSWCRAVCRRDGDDQLWPQVDHLLRTTAVALVERERAFLTRPR